MDQFVSRSVDSTANLNFVFLVYWFVVFMAAIIMIYYFPRIMGCLLSLLLKQLLWSHYKVRVKIEAIKISFLGGRVFIKNLTVITGDALVLVHQLNFTWRYWFWSVRQSQLLETQVRKAQEQAQQPQNIQSDGQKQRTRFLLEITGLEVFIYNRSASYDNILTQLGLDPKVDGPKAASPKVPDWSSSKEGEGLSDSTFKADENDRIVNEKAVIDRDHILHSPLLAFFPMDMHVHKGSVIVGNESTPSLLVLYFSTLTGSVDVGPTPNPLDACRVIYDVEMGELQAYLKPNVTYKGGDNDNDNDDKNNNNNDLEHLDDDNASVDAHDKRHTDKRVRQRLRRHGQRRVSQAKVLKDVWKHGAGKLWTVRSAGPFDLGSGSKTSIPSSGDAEHSAAQWHGLDRYLSGEPNDLADHELANGSDRASSDEYARYTHIIETSSAHLLYYYDKAGYVPPRTAKHDLPPEVSAVTGFEEPDIGNGGSPPQMGIDIHASGCTIHYGPWADRQRGPLQKMIFPPLSRDSEPFPALLPGQRRQYTCFSTKIEFDDETVIQVPQREPSKDEQYTKDTGGSVRPFGWIEVKVSKESSIVMSASYIPQAAKGWDNRLRIDLKRPEMSTSVNHDVVYKAVEHSIDAYIGWPLAWNGEAIWKFSMSSQRSKLYMLREHITLLGDLFTDFASGEPISYEEFRPFLYNLDWEILNFAIYMNVNEMNVIDNPIDHMNNTYIAFKGEKLDVKLDIPLETVYRRSTTFTYDLFTEQFTLCLETPPWSTISNFMDSPDIGRSYDYHMWGSYTLYTAIEIDSVDTIIVNNSCRDTTLECYGFFIKYFLNLKENYFGDHIHFRTLSEFTEEAQATPESNESVTLTPQEAHHVKNESDVFFTFTVDNGCIVLPVHAYDCGAFIGIQFESLDVDFRLNTFYMDLQADFSPATGKYVDMAGFMDIFTAIRDQKALGSDFTLDGLSIHGHRMFGPRPEELTYFCRWNFVCGDIMIDSNPAFVNGLDQSVKSLVFGYKDDENSLQIPPPVVFDALNMTFNTPKINIRLNCTEYLFEFNLEPLSFKFSDQVTAQYSKRIDLKVQHVSGRAFKNDGTEILNLKTSLYFTNFVQKRDGDSRRLAQYDHMQISDGPFHRAPFLIPEDYRNRKFMDEYMCIVPSFSLPEAPPPYRPDTMDNIIQTYSPALKTKLYSANYDEVKEPPSKVELERTPYEHDPDCEYDSIICSIGAVDAHTNPEVLLALSSLITDSTNYSIYRVMNGLQIDTIRLIQKRNLLTEVRVKVECPSILVKSMKEHSSPDRLELDIASLSVTAEKSSSDDADARIAIGQASVKVQRKKENVAYAAVHGFAGDYDKELRHAIKSTVNNLAISVIPEHSTWMHDYLQPYVYGFSQLGHSISDLKENYHNAQRELLYSASTAGVQYNIHDPPCITKPSHVTRFSENHIRLQNSWRIISRLWYVLKSLPEDWASDENALFKDKQWRIPPDGPDEVYKIFMNWRQWESSNVQDSYILQNVYGGGIKRTRSRPDYVSAEVGIVHLAISLFPLTDVFVLSDISFTFNEDTLSDETRTSASTIAGEDIEDNLDISISVGSFRTCLDNIGEAVPYLMSMMTTLMDQTKPKKTKPKEKEEEDRGKDAASQAPVKPLFATVLIDISRFGHVFGIEKTKLETFGQNASVILSAIRSSKDEISATLITTFDVLETRLTVDKIRLAEFKCESHNMTLANAGSLAKGPKMVTITEGEMSFLCKPGSEGLARAINLFTKYEYPIIEPLVAAIYQRSRKHTQTPKQSELSKDELFDKLLSNVVMTVHFSTLFLQFEILSPIVYSIDLTDIMMNITGNHHGVIGNFKLSKVLTHITTNDGYEYAYTTLDSSQMTVAARPVENYIDTRVALSAGTFRIQLSQNDVAKSIIRAYHDGKLLCANLIMLDSKTKQLLKAVGRLRPSHTTKDSSKQTLLTSLAAILRVHIEGKIDSLFIISKMNENQIITEVSDSTMQIDTYDPVSKLTKPSGILNLPSTKVMFASSNSTRFTLFDMDLVVEVVNPSSENQKLQRMNIYSTFSRMVLNPYYANQLLEICIQMKAAVSKVKDLAKSSTAKVKTDKNSAATSDTIEAILSFFSISITAENFCFGWLFGPESKYYAMQYNTPGLIFGFENSEIICAKGAGRMSVDGTYLALAHGSGPTDFYPTSSENTALNRVFIPHLGLVYESGTNELRVMLDGDQIDVKLETDILFVSKPLASSVSSLQDKISQLRSQTPARNFSSPDDLTLFKIDSVTYVFNFVGAKIKISNPNIEINGQIPSLEMQCPQMNVVLKWTRGIQHIVSIYSSISETDNHLTYMCVPVISELVKVIKNSMRANKNEGIKPVERSETTPTATTTSPTTGSFDQWQKVLNRMSFNFTLKIHPQRLELSCEPRANVAAIVSTDDIHLVLNSDSSSFSALLYLQNMGAELRHTYSKEASALFSFRDLTLNATLAEQDGIKQFFTLARIDDVKAMINIQQRQDLDIFRDLWVPRDIQFRSDTKEATTSKKTFSMLLREVSTTSAFPWEFVLQLKKIQVQLRLGSSLGTLTANMENTWATAQKAVNWDQNFRLQFGSFDLESVGRMSGNVRTENVRIASMINWRKDGELLEIPQVVLSIGCHTVKAKASLDYHAFLVLDLRNLAVSLCNQRIKGKSDKLFVVASVESLKIFITALTASNLVDIYTIGLRIQQDIKASYKQVLNDTPAVADTTTESVSKTFLSAIQELHTELMCDFNEIVIEVFPSSLTGSQALVVSLGLFRAKFLQQSYRTVQNVLQLQFKKGNVSLSGFKKQPTESSLDDDTYVALASTARGGTIVWLPGMEIEMDTWRKPDSKVVNYTYDLTFDDKIDVRWNIGSVYFIRQMWYSHASALKSRLQALQFFTSDDNVEENYKESLLDSTNFEDKLKDAEEDEEYTYVPIREDNIDTPQLRDLGDATPPLEWFGLHRAKFPNLTYKAIENLQEMINEMELQYARVLH